MAEEIGVLQLTIQDNSESAAQGLGSLVGVLNDVKKAVSGGIKLSGVATQISNLATAVGSNSKALNSVGTFLNAIRQYKEAFQGTENVKFNTQPIEDLKSALGEGIKLGQAGTQLKNLREAITSDWGDKGEGAFAAMSLIVEGARGFSSANVPSVLSKTAKAISEYVDAHQKLSSSGGAHDFMMQYLPTDQSGAESGTSAGKYVGEGIMQGIESTKDAVGNAAAEIAQAIIDAIKDKLVIASPSKVTREYGKFTGLGLSEGLIETKGEVQYAAEAVAGAVKDTMGQIIGYGSPVMLNTNITDYMLSPLESLQQRFVMVGNAFGTFKENIDAAVPALQNYRDTVLGLEGSHKDIAEFSKKTGEELIKPFHEAERVAKESTERIVDEISKEIQATTQGVQEQVELRRSALELENQARLERNYSQYRELYMSGENGWKQQVPEMYGFTPRALEEGETYAEALKITMADVNEYVERYIANTNTPTGPLLRDTIDQSLGIGRAIKDAEQSAGTLQWAGFSIDEYIEAYSHVDYLKEKIIELKAELEEKVKFGAGNKDEIDSLVGKITRLSEEYNKLVAAQEEVSWSSESMRKAWDSVKKGLTSMFPTITSLVKRFQSMAKMRAIRYVIRAVAKGISEGVKNVYYYSQTIGGSFATSMDNAATSLQTMKNSIGASLAPAISALIPYLQTVVNWFITLVNYVNQFFALLNGQNTWTKALETQTTAYGDNAKAAKDASSAAKDLLADWDELNIIQSSSSGSGSQSVGDETDYSSMFEEVSDFSETIKDIVDFLKDNFESILAMVLAIKLALKLMRLSSALAETLPFLSTVLKGVVLGATIGVTILLTDLTGKAFIKSGNPAWLIADALTGAIGSKLAGSIATKIAGASVGTAVQGFTLILAGATNLENAMSAFAQQKKAEGWALASLGSVEAGVGTALVAKGLLGASTAFSFAVGGVLAAAALTVALGVAVEMSKDEIEWGTITLSKEDVQTYVETNFFKGIDVKATIDLVKATIDKVSVSKEDLEKQIAGTIPVLTTLKLGISDEDTYDELKKQIFGDSDNGVEGLLDKIQTYANENIQELKTSISLIPVVTATGDDVSSKFLTSGITGWNEVTNYSNHLGEELGKELSKGFTEDGLANFDEEAVKTLTEKLVRISKVVTGAQIEGAAQADLGMKLSELSLGDLTQDTVKDVVAAFSEYRGELTREYEQIYKESANQYLVLSRFYGEMANQAETEEERQRWIEKSDEFLGLYNEMIANMSRSIIASVNAASAPGIEMIRDFVQEKFGKEFDLFGSNLEDNGQFTGTGAFWQSLLNPDIGFNPEDDIKESAEKFNTFLKTWFGNENSFLAGLLNSMPEVNVFSLLTDEMQADLKKVIASRYGEEFANSLFEQYVFKPIEEAENAAEEAMNNAPTVETTSESAGETSAVESAKEQMDEATESAKEYTTAAEEAKTSTVALDNLTFDTSGVETSANAAATAIEEMARRIRDAFATLDGLSYEMDISGEKFSGAMHVLVPEIEQRASGGFVKSGDLVMANENGNFEMMGRMGSQPVVANNQQIVNGISQGVEAANGGVESRLGAIETLLTKILNKEFVATATPSSSWGFHNQQSGKAKERVTG